MKIAIIHDILVYEGGAEKVLYKLLKMFPASTVFTSYISKTMEKKMREFDIVDVKPGRLFQEIGVFSKHPNLIKLVVYKYWRSLDLSSFDLVISSSHSFSSKSVLTNGVPHISYIHTPPRYLYDEYNESEYLNHLIVKILSFGLMSYLRYVDRLGAKGPDLLIANSKTVRDRIKKYYKRDSQVVYPPVKQYKRKVELGKYYVCMSRLVRQKGVELVVKAFNQMEKKLVVIGSGREHQKICNISGSNIEVKGYLDGEELMKTLVNAKALINSSFDEDFGMVPVEMMSMGIPVIAFDSGGVSETVEDGETGLLYKPNTVEGIMLAVERFEKMKILSSDCMRRAKMYSEEVFEREFMKIVSKYV